MEMIRIDREKVAFGVSRFNAGGCICNCTWFYMGRWSGFAQWKINNSLDGSPSQCRNVFIQFIGYEVGSFVARYSVITTTLLNSEQPHPSLVETCKRLYGN